MHQLRRILVEARNWENNFENVRLLVLFFHLD